MTTKRCGCSALTCPSAEPPPLADANVVYYPELAALHIQNGKPFREGEEIARGVTVFYDLENECEVVAVHIDAAEAVLRPFVEAILARHGISSPPAAD